MRSRRVPLTRAKSILGDRFVCQWPRETRLLFINEPIADVTHVANLLAVRSEVMGYVLPFEKGIILMTYYYFKDHKGEWRWHLKAANGRIIADSGEGHNDEQECLDDIERVKGSAGAPVKEEKTG